MDSEAQVKSSFRLVDARKHRVHIATDVYLTLMYIN